MFIDTEMSDLQILAVLSVYSINTTLGKVIISFLSK